jgi:predicted permease
MTSLETLSSTLPIIFLVLAGILIRATHLIQPEAVADIKKLVVNVTLPLLLLKAFATMTFELRYLLIVSIIFLACTLVMFLTARLRVVPGLTSRYASYLMAGFEAGMLGYALFSSIYGAENISRFAVIDLGQVLFVFFVLITRLKFQQERRLNASETLLTFLKSPVIIAILAGILMNLSGAYLALAGWPITDSLLKTAEILAGLTTPLVALVIGYELRFQRSGLLQPFLTVFIRLVVWVALALALNHLVIRQLLGLDRLFEAAVLLMALLPAPFVIPLYLQESDLSERDYILNTLSLGTITALVGAIVVRMFY